MITVRTKGVPMKREVGKDEEGFDVFHLDETKFDGFEVALMTMRKCGYVDPIDDPRFRAMRAMKPEQLARFDVGYADRLAREAEARKR